MTGYEEKLLTRAEMLEDTGDLVQSIAAVLAGAQARGRGPGRRHQPGRPPPGRSTREPSTSYDAGQQAGPAARQRVPLRRRDPRGRQRSRGRSRGSGCGRCSKLQEQARRRAWTAAQAALAAAYAMPVKDKCDGCHAAREAAHPGRAAAASGCARPPRRSSTRWQNGCGRALGRLRAVPEDLGEVYELVYEFIRKGGKLPVFARWIEGEGTRV